MAQFNLNIGGVAVPMILITEGGYGAEYLARSAQVEYRIKIRHTQEKVAKNAQPVDRHNVELTVRTFPTADNPLGSIDQAYVVVRSNPNSSGAGAADVARSLAALLSNNAAQLVGWVSVLGSGNPEDDMPSLPPMTGGDGPA